MYHKMEKSSKMNLSHHNQLKYCTNRPKYRDGQRLTAVKVYTIVNESRHLLVFGVPRINLHQEVRQVFAKYGSLSKVKPVTEELKSNGSVEIEQFTDCYYVEFDRVYCARRAKTSIDRKSFYGGILHISYAPEYETVEDVRYKIKGRKEDINYRKKKNGEQTKYNSSSNELHEPSAKRAKNDPVRDNSTDECY